MQARVRGCAADSRRHASRVSRLASREQPDPTHSTPPVPPGQVASLPPHIGPARMVRMARARHHLPVISPHLQDRSCEERLKNAHIVRQLGSDVLRLRIGVGEAAGPARRAGRSGRVSGVGRAVRGSGGGSRCPHKRVVCRPGRGARRPVAGRAANGGGRLGCCCDRHPPCQRLDSASGPRAGAE